MNNLTNQFSVRDVCRHSKFSVSVAYYLRKVHFECVITGLFTVFIKIYFHWKNETQNAGSCLYPKTASSWKEETDSKQNPSTSFLKHRLAYKSSCTGSDHRSSYHSILCPTTTTSRNSMKGVNRANVFPKTSTPQCKPIRDFAVATDITEKCSNIPVNGILWLMRQTGWLISQSHLNQGICTCV